MHKNKNAESLPCLLPVCHSIRCINGQASFNPSRADTKRTFAPGQSDETYVDHSYDAEQVTKEMFYLTAGLFGHVLGHTVHIAMHLPHVN